MGTKIIVKKNSIKFRESVIFNNIPKLTNEDYLLHGDVFKIKSRYEAPLKKSNVGDARTYWDEVFAHEKGRIYPEKFHTKNHWQNMQENQP